MKTLAIFYPVLVLAGWTFIVLTVIPLVRVRSGFRREISADDFKFGESAAVPKYVTIPNRNYMNLLEFPLLLYVGCIVAYVATPVSSVMVTLAWTFVALRVVHSTIHLTYNRVAHRALVFGLSNAVLVALWVMIALRVMQQPA